MGLDRRERCSSLFRLWVVVVVGKMGPHVDTSAMTLRRPGLFFNWVVWLLNVELYVYICWLLTPYQSYHLQIFSVQYIVFLFCLWFL